MAQYQKSSPLNLAVTSLCFCDVFPLGDVLAISKKGGILGPSLCTSTKVDLTFGGCSQIAPFG